MRRIAGILVLLSAAASCKTAPSSKAYYDSVHDDQLTVRSADDPCPESATDCHPRKFLVTDDGLQKIALVNLDDPSKDWDIAVGATIWDMALAGNGKVLVTTTDGDGGFYEIDISQGVISQAFTHIGFVRSVQRLKNGHTLVAGENLAGKEGMVMIELDPAQAVLETKTKVFPKIKNSRVIRRTLDNTYLMGTTVDNQTEQVLMEMDEHGLEVQRFTVGQGPAHMGVRLANGDTVATSGRDLDLLIFDKNAKVKQTVKLEDQQGKVEIGGFQAGFFQILANKHIVMTNWQGKSANSGRKGRQLVEYNAKGKQVWAWKQDPRRFSSISSVIVLDGLDLTLAHDDTSGPLKPVR